MTHILKATKEHFRFSDLKALSTPHTTLSKTSNIPIRVLGTLLCNITRDGMYAVHKIAQEEQLIKHVVFKCDTQMEGFWIYSGDSGASMGPIAQELKLGTLSKLT